MRLSLVPLLRCPACGSELSLISEAPRSSDDVETGRLDCSICSSSYPIERGIPRFVPAENYAGNFGMQWNLFRKTQLDSHSGVSISRDRFVKYSGWTKEDLEGRMVLDAGCGAGRFAEIALSLGGHVIAIDYSNAIEAARDNLEGTGNIDFVQADINALPFAPATFPFVYCLGVIQHTPEPASSFAALAAVAAPGGRVAVDVYPALWKNWLYPKYWIRPLTRRMTAEKSLRVVRRLFPAMYGVSRALCRVPLIGHHLRYLVPVANYTNLLPLDDRQLREWGLLDTFDMWAPAYDQPQSLAAVHSWFESAGFRDIETFASGFFVGRGVKPAE